MSSTDAAGTGTDAPATERIIGPVLFLDDLTAEAMHLAALFIVPHGQAPGPVTAQGQEVPATVIARYRRCDIHRARFALPLAGGSYRWEGAAHPVAGLGADALRLAYVSCNGEETGDMEREGSERNAMWARLRASHEAQPFALLLHGGDQVYADEVTHGHPLSEDWPDSWPEDPDPAAMEGLREHLRERFLARYAAIYAAPDLAALAARIPSLMQWDDHDICDGWGSLSRAATASAMGQAVFAAAREAYLTFQAAAAEGDLPPRFADPAGGHLGWAVHGAGLRLYAPDLRSERGRRQVMGPGGWAMAEAEAARASSGHTFLLSSVPLLGPRLSILEYLMMAVPQMQKYEDDLRDQWQSRAHRGEWRRMLELVRSMAAADGQDITAVSGEIHLATRTEMELGGGRVLNQLVASGIAHRPPPAAWARTLGTLASLGEAPLPGHPIRIRPLPGQRHRYAAERNWLLLERRGARWSASWDLEHAGPTPPLPL
ncbi:alkaline phosphatase D family protein [Mangrovicoccus algicola]|uniref:Alkaline phosphatase D family protein n=1 Tax=Mangrovicoccus algicola TaxID=2771008 RepID=A0A8J7CIY7_9RHOB|nr:alkaline phosphatase D family protein [Mangrovicoccus algicola]MBE3640170.1 alkaline phosphatase D family protein [Mangrovicoccus algicola]